MNRRNFIKIAATLQALAIAPTIVLADNVKKGSGRFLALYYPNKSTGNWYKVEIPSDGALSKHNSLMDFPISLIMRSDLVIGLTNGDVWYDRKNVLPRLPSKQTMMYLRALPTSSMEYVIKKERVTVKQVMTGAHRT